MSIKTDNRRSLLRYWTTRYLATLCIGLIIIAFISIVWIRQTTLDNKLNLTKFLAEESADRVIDDSGRILHGRLFTKFIEERQKLLNLQSEPLLFIVNNKGNILYSNQGSHPIHARNLPLSLIEDPSPVQLLNLNKEKNIYIVKAPIDYNGDVLGWVVIIQPKAELVKTNQEYRLLATLLISLAILGWLVIYFLSRKLAKPIHDVANAAKQIKSGNYNTELPGSSNEKEVYELLDSFKKMAERLQQLESIRAELLAGITHELKTPVTSISSLIQAIKDEVVTGEEAKEFLEISLKETNRLQKMIEDLLDFNSFSAGAIRVSKEDIEINELVQEITNQWYVIQETGSIALELKLGDPVMTFIDPTRLEQILINLLNNAKDSFQGKGKITVLVSKDQDHITIDIADNGIGIPENEQELIFERFYRGEDKKHRIRGLGLGLPFSKMLTRALGGDLILKESTSDGTIFSVKIPIG